MGVGSVIPLYKYLLTESQSVIWTTAIFLQSTHQHKGRIVNAQAFVALYSS